METHEKEMLIKNYKDKIKLSIVLDNHLAIDANEEIIRLFFTYQEMLRFKNEARVGDVSESIKTLDEFEALLNKSKKLSGFGDKPYPLHWVDEYIEEAYDLYKDDFYEKEDEEKFKQLMELSISICR